MVVAYFVTSSAHPAQKKKKKPRDFMAATLFFGEKGGRNGLASVIAIADHTYIVSV